MCVTEPQGRLVRGHGPFHAELCPAGILFGSPTHANASGRRCVSAPALHLCRRPVRVPSTSVFQFRPLFPEFPHRGRCADPGSARRAKQGDPLALQSLVGERDDQNRFSMVGLHPRVATNLRMEDWLPYSFVGTSTGTTFARDRQHTNSGIMPVISHVQLGIRLRAIPIESDPENEQPPRYRLRLELKPVIGLWNPYNVPIRSRNYLVETIFPPMIQLGIREPDGTERETFSWLRLIWGNMEHTEGGASRKMVGIENEQCGFRGGRGSYVLLGNERHCIKQRTGYRLGPVLE